MRVQASPEGLVVRSETKFLRQQAADRIRGPRFFLLLLRGSPDDSVGAYSAVHGAPTASLGITMLCQCNADGD